MKSTALQDYFLLVLIVGALWLAALIFQPFVTPLVLAISFSVVVYPVYTWFLGTVWKSPSGAAAFTLLITMLGIILPVAGLATLIGAETSRLYGGFVDGSAPAQIQTILYQLQTTLPQDIPGAARFTESVSANINVYAREALTWATGHIGSAFSSIAVLFLKLFVFLIALFFFLRDGASFRATIIELSPLPDADDEIVFKKLGLAINSVIRGNLLIALIRSILSMIGFIFFGIPNPVLWGALAGIVGLIPGVGISIVFAPAILYAYFTAGIVPTLGLLAWGVLAVGLIDNILGPKLVGERAQLHPLFVLFAILGGIDLFGPVGIFLGPLSLSFLLALLSIYSNGSRKSIV